MAKVKKYSNDRPIRVQHPFLHCIYKVDVYKYDIRERRGTLILPTAVNVPALPNAPIAACGGFSTAVQSSRNELPQFFSHSIHNDHYDD